MAGREMLRVIRPETEEEGNSSQERSSSDDQQVFDQILKDSSRSEWFFQIQMRLGIREDSSTAYVNEPIALLLPHLTFCKVLQVSLMISAEFVFGHKQNMLWRNPLFMVMITPLAPALPHWGRGRIAMPLYYRYRKFSTIANR